MKRNKAASSAKNAAGGKSAAESRSSASNHVATFAKVIDGRKQPIRGLWIRNGRYYAQLKIENPITGIKKTKRVPLNNRTGEPVQTVAQAVAEMNRLRTQRADNALPVLARTPKFSDYAKRYLEIARLGKPGKEPKKPGTVEKEKAILGRWSDSIGDLRLDQIKRVHVNRFIEERLKENVSPRTINLDVITLRVVLKWALSNGIIQRLPTEGLQPLKVTTASRTLFTSAELKKLCESAFETKRNQINKEIPLTENAQQFTDYVKLMAFSGTRRNEALGLQWKDVDFDNNQLHVRRQVTSRGVEDLKNRTHRTVDFNPKLKAHLLEMKNRRAPGSTWLFPSPQRGDQDIPAKTFRESLNLVRTKAELPHFKLHDLRHHFISMCVMSGVDFMTIAAWVGHRDGGVLIGKVYGHLANEHRKAMAKKIRFNN